MKIIVVIGCDTCVHGAPWELDKPHYMCAKARQLNKNGPKPPEWCPLEDAKTFIKKVMAVCNGK